MDFKEERKERTALTLGPLGFYEYNRMSFGFTNSQATYQRMVEGCLSDLNLKICCIFIHDVIIFVKSYEEHLDDEIDPEKTERVKWSAPTNPEDARRFLGFMGYYRMYI